MQFKPFSIIYAMTAVVTVGVASASSLIARRPDNCVKCCTITTTSVTVPPLPPVTLDPDDSCVIMGTDCGTCVTNGTQVATSFDVLGVSVDITQAFGVSTQQSYSYDMTSRMVS